MIIPSGTITCLIYTKDKNCKFSHKPSHLEAVKKKLAKRNKGRGSGGHRRKGRAGASIEERDDGDDYIPHYEIEVTEGDEPLDDDDE